MVSKKKKLKSGKKTRKSHAKGMIWKASLLSAVVLPSVFVLIKEEPVQAEGESDLSSVTSVGLGMISKESSPQIAEASFTPAFVSSSEELAVIEFEPLMASSEEAEENDFGLEFIGIGAIPRIDKKSVDYTPPPTPPVEQEKSPMFHSRLKVEGTYNYVQLYPQAHESFHGNLGGIDASYDYRPMNFFYGGAAFSWKQGITKSGHAKRFLLYFDAQEKLGYTFASPCKAWNVSLFSGFGYRYIGHKLTQPGDASLRFKYQEFYVPVGMASEYIINSYLAFGANLTWMPQVFSTVGIDPLKGAKWSLTNTISNLTAELPFIFTVTKNKKLHVTVTPFYQYWQDGHSTAKLSDGTSLGLPMNTYNFYGANVGIDYRF